MTNRRRTEPDCKRHSRFINHRPFVSGVGLILTALLVMSTAATPKPSPKPAVYPPDWTRQIGKYRLVHWTSTTEQRQTLVLRDPKGGTVIRVSDAGVFLDDVRDITGDSVPEVIFHSWTGGAHGGFTYYVYSLGTTARNRLVYHEGNSNDYDDLPDFALADLDHDGIMEILSWDDTFAYYHVSFAGSPRLPFVFAYRNGRYVDVTTRYPKRVRDRMNAAKRRVVAEAAKGNWAAKNFSDWFAPTVEWYAHAALLGQTKQANIQITELLPDKERVVFIRHCREIEQMVAGRGKKLSYLRGSGHIIEPEE